MILKDLREANGSAVYDLCVVGSGPVGLACSMKAASLGLQVLLLESGPITGSLSSSEIGVKHRLDQRRHASIDVAVRRGLGGTSSWWGGRCVPFDDIDFARSGWPFEHSEVERYYGNACQFFGIVGDKFFRDTSNFKLDPIVCPYGLERWTPQIDMAVKHRAKLESLENLTVVCDSTVTGIDVNPADPEGKLETHCVILNSGGKTHRLRARSFVLAAGGLETTRLLSHISANSAWKSPMQGIGYMGHVSGKIADIVFTKPADIANFDFFLEGSSYARRRFTLSKDCILENGLLNTAFWADNPPFADASHRSGVLSLVWYALAIPWLGRRLVSEGVRLSHIGASPHQWFKHLGNILASPFATAKEILRVLHVRFVQKPAMPGFIVRNKGGRYALHFHSEQSPLDISTVGLNDKVDAFGVPSLNISLQFSESDAERIVRAHEVLDQALRASGKGRLEYYDSDVKSRVKRVLDGAADGFHQIGTTRMGADPQSGVVDANCRVYGFENLYIASSSVFPSSGQANPTFLAAALALRLADHLAKTLRANAPESGRPGLAEAL